MSQSPIVKKAGDAAGWVHDKVESVPYVGPAIDSFYDPLGVLKTARDTLGTQKTPDQTISPEDASQTSPTPTPSNPDAAANISSAQEAERKARGRASTILTSNKGVSDSGSNVARRTLLGK